ncbi:hypothetical protein EDB86DRAFT_2836241 [Lactarius hatsudake]|nr:hypothetical protein EDB86DRAFT_2836241 [Lactarius hatsudake]
MEPSLRISPRHRPGQPSRPRSCLRRFEPLSSTSSASEASPRAANLGHSRALPIRPPNLGASPPSLSPTLPQNDGHRLLLALNSLIYNLISNPYRILSAYEPTLGRLAGSARNEPPEIFANVVLSFSELEAYLALLAYMPSYGAKSVSGLSERYRVIFGLTIIVLIITVIANDLGRDTICGFPVPLIGISVFEDYARDYVLAGLGTIHAEGGRWTARSPGGHHAAWKATVSLAVQGK